MDIFVPAHTQLRLKARQVIPSPGDLLLDCACGSKSFRMHVRAGPIGPARIAEFVCDGCERLFRVTADGHIEGDGKVTVHKGKSDGSNH